jgi:hypothetical protein
LMPAERTEIRIRALPGDAREFEITGGKNERR